MTIRSPQHQQQASQQAISGGSESTALADLADIACEQQQNPNQVHALHTQSLHKLSSYHLPLISFESLS